MLTADKSASPCLQACKKVVLKMKNDTFDDLATNGSRKGTMDHHKLNFPSFSQPFKSLEVLKKTIAVVNK